MDRTGTYELLAVQLERPTYQQVGASPQQRLSPPGSRVQPWASLRVLPLGLICNGWAAPQQVSLLGLMQWLCLPTALHPPLSWGMLMFARA